MMGTFVAPIIGGGWMNTQSPQTTMVAISLMQQQDFSNRYFND